MSGDRVKAGGCSKGFHMRAWMRSPSWIVVPRCRVRTGLEPVWPSWLGHTQEESDGEENFLLRVRALLPHHTTTGSGLVAEREREGNDASVDLVSASSPLMSFKLRLNMNSRAVPIALAWMH